MCKALGSTPSTEKNKNQTKCHLSTDEQHSREQTCPSSTVIHGGSNGVGDVAIAGCSFRC
jgi:hypothetical protein